MNMKYNKKNKNSKMKRAICSVDWDVKTLTKDAAGKTTIEGFANTSDKDRVKDIILPSAFEKTLKEYQDNPIILFQHDWNIIIGKAILVKIIDGVKVTHPSGKKGLWIKVEISDSEDCKDIKTKIDEGLLKKFSIGYNEIESTHDRETDTNVVKELELLEISVVGIPANINASFSKVSDEEGDEKKLIDEGMYSFLSDSINELKSDEKIDSDFLKELVNIYYENRSN